MQLVRAAKAVPCADCGVEYPACVMDFDHKGSEKKFQISNRYVGSLSKLLAEIGKCDVVCANCHRIRTNGSRRQRVEPTGCDPVLSGATPDDYPT